MLLLAVYLLFPALIIVLCQKVALLDKIGAVVLAFGVGIFLALFVGMDNLAQAETLAGLQKDVSEVSIALALPLLLFSIDVKGSLAMAGDTLKGMLLALLAVLITSLVGVLLFNDLVTGVWQAAGMAVGAYTGGGPNIAAIKTAIEADESVFVAMVSYDMMLSSVYLIFVMTVAQKIFGLFLRPYEFKGETVAAEGEVKIENMESMADESAHSYKSLTQLSALPQTLLALLCSGVVVGGALGIAALVPESSRSTVTIVSITTLALALSFVPQIRALKNSFRLGMYLILVFCFTMGTMLDGNLLQNLDFALIGYISFILGGSLILQAVLCKLWDVDTDTFLITSSAAIMSVPFIAVIAGALKNREIILPGFAVAIIGYALGNYLGILVANAARWLVGA